jgi:DNA-binding SARP family transcriptional activator
VAVELRLFGSVSVRVEGRTVAVTGRQPAHVLRALAVTPRDRVQSDALVEAAWPVDPPANPAKALQTVVMRLRRSVDDGLVATVDGGYALGPGVVTDVESVDGLITRGLDLALDPRERVDALASALDAWIGSPFQGLDDWAPARAESARLDERRARAEDEWLALRLELGAPDAIVAELEAAVATEPLREQRWALLVRALRDSGRTADALEALDRARRVLALELGVRPGAVLQALEDEVLVATASPVDDPALRLERHLEAAAAAELDGDPRRAAKELGAAAELARETGRSAAAQADLLLALGRAQRRAGEPAAAQDALVAAASLARHAGDAGRLAEAALAASGEAWQTTLDASAVAIELVEEALAALTPAPSPVRARLLARRAVAGSHVHAPKELAETVSQADVIARIVDDPLTTATLLLARSVVDQDPFHIAARRSVLERLVELASTNDRPDWRAWGVPHLARLTAQEGDVDGALALLDELGTGSAFVSEHLAGVAEGSARMLRASVTGSFDDALAAIDVAARAFEPTMIDPSGAAILRWAHTTVAQLVYDQLEGAPDATMPFPLATMNAMTAAYVAAVLGATGRAAEGHTVLGRIDPDRLSDLPRDVYWLNLLWALGRAVWELDAQDHAAALHELAAPVTDLLVVDAGFMFIGAVAHHAGLGSAVAGRSHEARELLSSALATHERLRSPHWTKASRRALESLPSAANRSR